MQITSIIKCLTIKWLSIISLLLLIFSNSSLAKTEAYKIIENQATATYFDPEKGYGSVVFSNIAQIQVSAIYNFDLILNRSINAGPGHYINFSHVLTNNGNISDSYNIYIENLKDDNFDLNSIDLFYDSNLNGNLDPGELQIDNNSIYLNSGESAYLIVAGKVPETVLQDMTSKILIKAASASNNELVKQNTDIITIDLDVMLRITKTNQPICIELIEPGNTINYRIEIINIGYKEPYEKSIPVKIGDTINQIQGILLEDTIPVNTIFDKTQKLSFSPVYAKPVVMLSNNIDLFWTDWDSLSETDDVVKIGLIIPLENLKKDTTCHLSFSVKIIDNATTGTIIKNIASVDLNGDNLPEFESNETCNKVFGDSARINFIDSKHNYTQSFQMQASPKYTPERDNVFVEVVSSSFNSDPNLADEIIVSVQSSSTGDSIIIRLFETGNNTCIFRSKIPLILTEEIISNRKRSERYCFDSDQCYLSSTKIDMLVCEVEDPVEGRLSDIASIEPFGVIFDSVTLIPVEGATITLHNIDDSEILDIFGNKVMPEISDVEGKYQFSNVQPGEYYIEVTPPLNYKFPSIKRPNMLSYKYAVKEASYGRNGFINIDDAGVFSLGLSKDALILDIPLDQININKTISLKKSVLKTIALIEQSISYILTVNNDSGDFLINTQIFDFIPEGFEYVPSSIKRLDNKPVSEPILESNESVPEMNKIPDLIINIGNLAIDETIIVTYDLLVTKDANSGENINFAIAKGQYAGASTISSSIVQAEVDVLEGLFIEKSALLNIVNIGQAVKYKIHIENRTDIDLYDANILDWMPPGFTYISGKSFLNEIKISDPDLQLDTNNEVVKMAFDIGDFPKDSKMDIIYEVKPGFNALKGDKINKARLSVNMKDKTVLVSGISEASIEIQTGPLILEKTTSVKTGYIGDLIPYNIKIKNSTDYKLTDVIVYDTLPYGFSYENGSAMISDKTILNVYKNGNDLRIFLPDLEIDQEININYILRLKPGALDSNGINSAYVTGKNDQDEIKNSGVSRAKIDIKPESIFSDDGIIFGKIFIDENENNLQDKAEWPLGAVKLFLEDGTWVITDENGQYCIYGVKPGLHVLKIDPLTVPQELEFVVYDLQQAGDPQTRFVNITQGEFHRADFILSCPCDNSSKIWSEIKARNNNIKGEWMLEKLMENNISNDNSLNKTPSNESGDISSGLVYPESLEKQWNSNAGSESKSISINEMLNQSHKNLEQYAKEIKKETAHKGQFLWPDSEISRDGKFIAVVRMGIEPNLEVNDQLVNKDRLGEYALNNQENAQILAWYGVKLKQGKNKVGVTGFDSFGNKRILVENEFYLPGPPENLKIILNSDYIEADGGKSALPIEIRLNDINQKPASGIHFITIEASDGIFVEPDIQPNEPAHQIRIENGKADLHLRSSDRTGTLTIKAFMGTNLSDEAEINMISPKRPLIAVGLFDLSLNINDLNANAIKPTNQKDGFDEEIQSENRIALFLKGKIKGGFLLTLAYDSKKNDDTKLFRDIDPDAYYPIYGDASIKGFDAQCTGKLYVKIEKGKNQIMWGDYVTDHKQDENIKLGRFQRTLTGANIRLESQNSQLSFFGANSDNNFFVEEIQANGTATFYFVNKDRLPIKPNSENIEIITRDIDNPGMIIKTRSLKRFDDYLIDSFSGYITFHEAIASKDENGNIVFIRISYASESQTQSTNIFGSRFTHNFKNIISFGGSFTLEDNQDNDFNISSAFVTIKPDKNHKIITEIASQNFEEIPSGYASRLEYTGKWFNNISSTFSFAHADNDFNNPDASIASGRQELSGEFVYTPLKGTQIKTTITQSKGLELNDERISTSIDIQKQFSTVKTIFGFRNTKQKNTADNDSINSLKLSLEKSFNILNKPGKILGEIEQDIDITDRKSLKVRGEYFVQKQTKIYSEHELMNSLDGITGLSSNLERSNTKFGISTQLMGSTQTYAEHRIRGGISGRELESVTGIKNSFDIVPKLSFSPQFEYVHTYRGDGSNDAFSCSFGLNDKRNKNRRSSLRLDTRLGKQTDYYGFQSTHAQRFSQNWSGIIREEYAMEDSENQEKRVKNNLSIGFALRPKLTNKLHLLNLFKWKEEQNQNDIEKRQVFILSNHFNYQLKPCTIASGHLASKWQKIKYNDSYRSNIYLIGFKLKNDINRRWGINFRYGLLTPFDGSLRTSFGIGLDYLVKKNLCIGFGYQFLGFKDNDLDEQRYYAQGLRIGLQFKFDESLINGLSIFQ